MLEFKETEILYIKSLRNAYFYEISIAQDLYLEWMIHKGVCYKICQNSHEIGYFIIGKDGDDRILLEYYLVTEALFNKEDIFKTVVSTKNITKVYCKSFDHILLTCSHTFTRSSKVISMIFRDYINGIGIEYENQFKVRIANKSDIPMLLSYNEGLYRDIDDLEYRVANNMLYLFERNHLFIGCGRLIKVLQDKNYYDIGVWTKPEIRKEGYGAMMMAYMKRYCFSHSYIPICSCTINDTASIRTLQKNGFVAKHCLIEFEM